MKRILLGLLLTICMIVSAESLNVSAMTITDETEVLKEIKELKTEIELLKKEINELKEVTKEFMEENKSIKEAPSDASYEEVITDFAKYGESGYTTSYIENWDKVTHFKVGDVVYKGDSIFGFKFPKIKITTSKSGIKIPSLDIFNKDHEYSKLKFSYAFDDIAKNYPTDLKPYICVTGYSELLGTETIINKPIERNEQIQTLELDIEKYTKINIFIVPRINRKDWIKYNGANIYSSYGGNYALEDYILLMNVQVK